MNEYLPDSPNMAIFYCPSCEPDRDPLAEILDIRWCDAHIPQRYGNADEEVGPLPFMNGSDESGGDYNRRWCELFRPKPS